MCRDQLKFTFLIVFSITTLGTTLGATRILESGKSIPVGTVEGIGPLSAGISSLPVGVASVLGAKQPDLFVVAGKFSQEPGLYLYPWVATAKSGAPVFGKRIRVKHPFFVDIPPPGTIFQTKDGVIHGVWLTKNDLVHSVYDAENHTFSETSRITLSGLPRRPNDVAVLPNPDGTVEILLGISNGVSYRTKDFSWRDDRYRPYDGAGIWRGGLPYVSMYAMSLPSIVSGPATNPRLVSTTTREVMFSYSRLTVVNLGSGHTRDVITGSRFGGLHYYDNATSTGVRMNHRRYAVGANGIALRHPSTGASPVVYPNPATGLSDLIVGGEGSLYYYGFSGEFLDGNKPIFDDPIPVLEGNAHLYGGSLPVPSVVDWDGDGVLDIVSGNSEGRVLFFRNAGSNSKPAFIPGIPLQARGHDIHIQPGYRGDIQGPGEARWGYTCPTVADWNEDGLPDILMSDSTARHTVYMNRGKRKNPNLDVGHPIYCDDLDLHGTWRVKPAVAKLGHRMAYVALDDDDEFHLYWRIDDYNVEDGGKLRLGDGSAIGANFLKAGGTGRLKLNLVDWDRDGLIDIIVGTPRHGSVPNPTNGLPQSLGLPGAAVLFMRNVHSNIKPVFEYPVLMKFRNSPIFLNHHACGPAVAEFEPGRLDLIVGEQGGRFIYYSRDDLSIATLNAAKKASGTILITEVMANPADVSDEAGEWFEFFNYGDVRVDLNGWILRTGMSTSYVIDNNGPLIIQPKGYLVFGREKNRQKNNNVPVDYAYGKALSFQDDHGMLAIFNGDIQVHAVRWHVQPQTLSLFCEYIGSVSEGNSLAMTRDYKSGSTRTWAEDKVNVINHGKDHGTPGAPNHAGEK